MRLKWLGQAAAFDPKAWDAYFRGVQNQLTQTWSGTLLAFRTLRGIRERFNLPVVAPPGESGAAASGAMSQSEYDSLLELAVMVNTANKAIDEAISGRRKVGYEGGDLQIERLSTDVNRIEVRGGVPTLIENATGAKPKITGTIDGLGIAPLVWVGLAVGAVAVTLAECYAVVKVCESATAIVHEKTLITIANHQHDLVVSGKATPAEAKALTDSIMQAEVELQAKKVEQGKSVGLTPDTNKTIRTVAIVAAIGAGLYLISKVIPERVPRIIPARA